jgi:putative glutamine amidotransferase
MSRARRPTIGITPDFAAADAQATPPRYELKVAYADAVLRAGGLPWVVPYSEEPAVVDAYLEQMAGLVVTGGAFDIPPEAYGDAPRAGLGALKEGRTRFETALVKGALARQLPILGVCGGMQLLNVVLGGTLVQDIALEWPGATEHEQKHDRTQPQHPVEVKAGTLLAECVGQGQLMVNSTHHQAVRALGAGVVASAAALDGIVEALEAPAHPFALGVQWHPELLIQSMPVHLGVYQLLVGRAGERR